MVCLIKSWLHTIFSEENAFHYFHSFIVIFIYLFVLATCYLILWLITYQQTQSVVIIQRTNYPLSRNMFNIHTNHIHSNAAPTESRAQVRGIRAQKAKLCLLRQVWLTIISTL